MLLSHRPITSVGILYLLSSVSQPCHVENCCSDLETGDRPVKGRESPPGDTHGRRQCQDAQWLWSLPGGTLHELLCFHLLPPPLVASKSNGLTVTLVVSLVTSHEGVSKLGANTQASPRRHFWGGGWRGEARRWAQLPHTLVDLPPPAVLCVDM